MTVLTSTMRMQLDAADFVKNAKHVADAVGADVKKIEALKHALADSGASSKLQASLVRLGASTSHVEGLKRAMEEFRREQGLTGKAWGDLTKDQKRALQTFESTTAATMRAVVAQEKAATAAILRDTDERSAALLSKENALREKMIAADRKAEDQRIAIVAAAAAEKATIAGREVAMRSAIEREVTAKHRAGIAAREGASREELATVERIATLEREARVRAIHAETTAIVAARHKQAEAEAEAIQHAKGRAGVGHMVAGVATGYLSAHGMVRPAEKAYEAGAERQTATIGMQRAGMRPDEIVRAQDLAVKVARDVGNMTATQVMDLHKEARSAVQHPEEVFELLPDLARAASALKGMGAQGNVADLVKAGESLGLMGDKERFRKFLDSQVRAQGVMGKTVTTEQTYEAAKYSKSAGSTLSDDFLNLTMPSLIQELHGSSAGDAIAGVSKTLRGGLAHQHLAVTQLDKMGLLEDPSKIVRAKGSGEIMGYTGKVKGDSLLASDPDRWFNEVYKDAAEKKMGVKSMEDMNLLLSQTLGKTGANVGRIFIQQAETFAQHRENNRNAPGTEEQIRLQREDPKVAVQTFNDALDDLGAAVTGPVMGRIGLGLTDLAGYVRNVSDAAKDHPNIALGVGAAATAGGLAASGTLAYYVATGFGLPAAAGQLSASAIALEAAAAKIGAGGAVSTAEKVAEAAAPGIGLASKLAIGVPLVGAGLFVADAMVNRRDSSKALVDGGRPDALGVNDQNSMLPGFDVGGWTGTGGHLTPAGVVHREEFVVRAGPAAKHRAILEVINRGDILPGFAGGGAVAMSRAGTGDGLARVALAPDSTSGAWLRDTMRDAVMEALRRERGEAGDGAGGDTGGAGYGGVSDHHAAPSIRYGRQHEGGGGGADVGGRASRMSNDVAGRASAAMRQLEGLGWSHEAAAAAIGNAQQESGVRSDGPLGDTKRFGFGDDAAHGMFQWRGQRFRDLKAFAAERGKQWQDFETQVAFFDKESKKYGSAEWRQTHDILHANRGMKRFEGYGDDSFGMRLANARQLAAGKNDGGFYPATATAPSADAGSTAPAGASARAVDILGNLNGASSGQVGHALGSAMHPGQWCADAVNASLKAAGVKGSGSSMANSFKDWGKHVDFGAVKRGDVIVEDHGRGRGHVGFATGAVERDKRTGEVVAIGMTSGNHGNRVVRDYMERVGQINDLRRSSEEAQRDAERAVLPRKPPAAAHQEPDGPLMPKRAPGAPTATADPQHHAAAGTIDFDHGPILQAIAHVDTLHRKLAGLKGATPVQIDHRHHGAGGRGGESPGAVRTSLNGRFGSDGRAWG